MRVLRGSRTVRGKWRQRLAAVAVVGAVVGAATPAVASINGSIYNNVATVNGYGNATQLNSISCPTVSFCAAADSFGGVATYDGKHWSQPTIVNTELAGFFVGLVSVSCSTVPSDFCAAIDDRGYGETYNGTTWSAPVHMDTNGGANMVSCPTANFCAAVDNFGDAVLYDGSTWSAPTPIDLVAGLISVSCPTTTFCVAGGADGTVATYNGSAWSAPVAIDGGLGIVALSCVTVPTTFCAASDGRHWMIYDGTSWSTPRNFRNNYYQIQSISCVSPTYCEAVSSFDATTFNGAHWTPETAIPTLADLTSVTCPALRDCTAAFGDYVETLKGTTWQPMVAVEGGSMSDVSCVGSTFCGWVTGSQGGTFNPTAGTWTPFKTIAPGDDLLSISCSSRTFCAAVGPYKAVTFNGSTWSAPVALPASTERVSCTSSTFCVATGGTGSNGEVEMWNGATWTAQTVDPLISLIGVSCTTSPSLFCVAIDGVNVVTYNGSTWSSPEPISTVNGGYVSISCPLATFCMATNGPTTVSGNPTTDHWSKAIATGMSAEAVFCRSRSFCAAVGQQAETSTYSGTSWAAPSQVGPPAYTLDSVSCWAVNKCVALEGTQAFWS
jgi:hypothetical protein